ncbi:MAG: hypothetical protein ACE5IL_03145 [Myxococcota bacterium]
MSTLDGVDLKRFGVSPERGFLPSPDPLVALPERFEPWETVASELAGLRLAGALGPTLESLPPFGVTSLAGEAEFRRAMLLLSFLGHAWVFGQGAPVARIPAKLAGPWCSVARELGRPPVLSYASYALENWRRLDPAGPIALANLSILQGFGGGQDEAWFITIHVAIEARSAPLLRALGPAQRAARDGDARALEAHLDTIGDALECITATLSRMPEHCDPYIYFQRVRPWIHGWKDHPALPEGVIYEGQWQDRPQRFRGETGAQSSIVPALDSALGVSHGDDPLRAYLAEMRDYMPPRHRAFIEAIEAGSSVRAAVREGAQGSPSLRESYDRCLQWLERFRSVHLEFAHRYIFAQSRAASANPSDRGTGGTPFLRYLEKHRDETARTRRS